MSTCVDVAEKYQLLPHEMIQHTIEMDEKMAEMETTYMYRLLEQPTNNNQPPPTYTTPLPLGTRRFSNPLPVGIPLNVNSPFSSSRPLSLQKSII